MMSRCSCEQEQGTTLGTAEANVVVVVRPYGAMVGCIFVYTIELNLVFRSKPPRERRIAFLVHFRSLPFVSEKVHFLVKGGPPNH